LDTHNKPYDNAVKTLVIKKQKKMEQTLLEAGRPAASSIG